MDNQPRVLPGDNPLVDHSFSAWVDATAQGILSARLLARMADVLGAEWARRPEVMELRREAALLST